MISLPSVCEKTLCKFVFADHMFAKWFSVTPANSLPRIICLLRHSVNKATLVVTKNQDIGSNRLYMEYINEAGIRALASVVVAA